MRIPVLGVLIYLDYLTLIYQKIYSRIPRTTIINIKDVFDIMSVQPIYYLKCVDVHRQQQDQLVLVVSNQNVFPLMPQVSFMKS